MFLKFFKFVVMQRVTRVYQRQLSYLSVIVHTGRLAMFSYVYGDRTIKTCIHVPVAGQWRRGYYYGDRRKSVCRSCSYVSGGRNNSLLAMIMVTGIESISPAKIKTTT